MATKNSVNSTNVTHTLLVGTGSGYTSLANGTTGQFLGANTGADPSWQTFSGGKVVKIATASTNTEFNLSAAIPDDDTIPQNTEGTEILTCAITPTNASSVLLIDFTTYGINSNNSFATAVSAIFVDSTANAIAAGFSILDYKISTNPQVVSSCVLRCIVSAGSTSSRTYKVRAGPSDATWPIQLNGGYFGGVESTFLTITEFAP